MKRILTFIPLLIAICTQSAFAIVDTNDNDMSDLWEFHFNGEQLFGETFSPDNDDDGDGWTNRQEAAAGTDPRNANPPDGILRQEFTILHDVYLDLDHNGIDEFYTDVAKICWPVIAGKQYTLLLSPDLTDGSWIGVESARADIYGTRTVYFPLAEEERLFWKVKVEDVESDDDELNDWEEGVMGLNPLDPDTDRDGIRDDIDLTPADNNNDADPDGHRMDPGIATGLVAWWDFQDAPTVPVPPTSPATSLFPNRTGLAAAHTLSLIGGEPSAFCFADLGGSNKPTTATRADL